VDSLRLEKGYCAFGSDLTMLENPFEAGLDYCVKLNDDGNFIGRDALLKIKKTGITQRLSTLIIGDEDYLPIYGGEAVISNGTVIGRLRSAGYGYMVKKNIGYTYLPLELTPVDTQLEIELFGERVAARVAARALVDPDGNRLRS
jgi:4-methylaminobutanoate oxidase (formaldehyde-forming)